MAKKRTKESKQPTRKQVAYTKADRKKERRLLIAVGIVAGVIVLVLIFGLVQALIVKPQSPVAKVDGASISTVDYQKLYRFQSYQLQSSLQQLQQQQAQFADNEEQQFLYQYMQQNIDQMESRQRTLPQDVLNEMIDQELVRQEAERLGITVSEEEVAADVEKEFGYDPNPPTPTATPTLTATQVITLTPTPTLVPMTEDEFKQAYSESLRRFSQVADFGEEDLQALYRNNLLAARFQEHLEAEVPTTDEQIHPSHILIQIEVEEPEEGTTPTPEEQAEARLEAGVLARAKAEEVLQRVTDGGEDFVAVAEEVSDDPGSKEEGGDLGWHPRGDFVPEFDEVAFSLTPGQIYTDVVESQFGYHIIKLEEFDPTRELDENTLQRRKSQVLQDWLAEQQDTAEIERYWSRDMVPTPAQPRIPIPR